MHNSAERIVSEPRARVKWRLLASFDAGLPMAVLIGLRLWAAQWPLS